jgi:hypothetical protein
MEGVQMSDTPISDSTPHNVADLGMRIRMIERELNAANSINCQQQLLDEQNLRLQERIKRLEEELNELRSDESRLLNSNGELERRIKRMDDCIETAWGIIANVSGGDWTRQEPHWQEAVVRWRDNDFHPIMKELSERKAKEAKP